MKRNEFTQSGSQRSTAGSSYFSEESDSDSENNVMVKKPKNTRHPPWNWETVQYADSQRNIQDDDDDTDFSVLEDEERYTPPPKQRRVDDSNTPPMSDFNNPLRYFASPIQYEQPVYTSGYEPHLCTCPFPSTHLPLHSSEYQPNPNYYQPNPNHYQPNPNHCQPNLNHYQPCDDNYRQPEDLSSLPNIRLEDVIRYQNALEQSDSSSYEPSIIPGTENSQGECITYSKITPEHSAFIKTYPLRDRIRLFYKVVVASLKEAYANKNQASPEINNQPQDVHSINETSEQELNDNEQNPEIDNQTQDEPAKLELNHNANAQNYQRETVLRHTSQSYIQDIPQTKQDPQPSQEFNMLCETITIDDSSTDEERIPDEEEQAAEEEKNKQEAAATNDNNGETKYEDFVKTWMNEHLITEKRSDEVPEVTSSSMHSPPDDPKETPRPARPSSGSSQDEVINTAYARRMEALKPRLKRNISLADDRVINAETAQRAEALKRSPSPHDDQVINTVYARHVEELKRHPSLAGLGEIPRTMRAAYMFSRLPTPYIPACDPPNPIKAELLNIERLPPGDLILPNGEFAPGVEALLDAAWDPRMDEEQPVRPNNDDIIDAMAYVQSLGASARTHCIYWKTPPEMPKYNDYPDTDDSNWVFVSNNFDEGSSDKQINLNSMQEMSVSDEDIESDGISIISESESNQSSNIDKLGTEDFQKLPCYCDKPLEETTEVITKDILPFAKENISVTNNFDIKSFLRNHLAMGTIIFATISIILAQYFYSSNTLKDDISSHVDELNEKLKSDIGISHSLQYCQLRHKKDGIHSDVNVEKCLKKLFKKRKTHKRNIQKNSKEYLVFQNLTRCLNDKQYLKRREDFLKQKERYLLRKHHHLIKAQLRLMHDENLLKKPKEFVSSENSIPKKYTQKYRKSQEKRAKYKNKFEKKQDTKQYHKKYDKIKLEPKIEPKENDSLSGMWYSNLHEARKYMRIRQPSDCQSIFHKDYCKKFKRSKINWYFKLMQHREGLRYRYSWA